MLIFVLFPKFNRLIDKLDKAKTDTMDEEYINLDKQNLDEREISEFGKGIANIIHTNIHNGDVFWQFLFLPTLVPMKKN